MLSCDYFDGIWVKIQVKGGVGIDGAALDVPAGDGVGSRIHTLRHHVHDRGSVDGQALVVVRAYAREEHGAGKEEGGGDASEGRHGVNRNVVVCTRLE